MSQNPCARPECGHFRHHWDNFGNSVCEEAICDCRGYRTPEQQEAWEDLETLYSATTSVKSPWGTVARLLELYP